MNSESAGPIITSKVIFFEHFVNTLDLSKVSSVSKKLVTLFI
jgi:hypothetical protein